MNTNAHIVKSVKWQNKIIIEGRLYTYGLWFLINQQFYLLKLTAFVYNVPR